ncbi:MAG: potassium channel protein [Deltaproteobacteria bacterium]|nr:potassium channel protein [Deltaproteobacteria bacterium]MBK8237743.1 potassium channel protein [Deltaproteobacteria bacterium]MBK8720114.1 potassium channel protein [Deltaproteobacteria bacterium]MBP7289083.1 potassium channel protein [Nannocystaceae bacterium]
MSNRSESWNSSFDAYAAARRRVAWALVVLVLVVAVGAAGYWYIGWLQSPGLWRLRDCVYMTVITITTVGYGEILDFQAIHGGREWTQLLLVFGVAADLYVVSTITSFFVESDFVNIRRWRKLERRMHDISNHYIVCGIGRTGIHVVNELVAVGHDVVAVDGDEAVLEELRERGILTVHGDATDDDVLDRAGLRRAKGVVATLDDDKTNMFVVVSARQTNPKLRIVVKALSPSAAEKLRRAGADAVVTPNFIGGMRIASELLRPHVVRFLDEMLRDKDARLRIEEATITAAGSLADKTLRAANLRESAGVLVLAVRSADGGVNYVPPSDLELRVGQTLIAIGRPDEIAALRRLAGA